MSARNAGKVIGRIAAKRVFTTDKGYRHVFLTVAADRDYTPTQSQQGSDMVPLEAWLKPEVEGEGIYGMANVGDLVAADYVVRSSTYPDPQTGEVRYATSLVIDRQRDLQLLESKAVTQQRQIRKLQAQSGAQAA